MDAALLDAITKIQLGATVKWMPDELDHGFTADQALQDDLEVAVKGGFDPQTPGTASDLSEHAFAVADLSDNVNKPAYAGWRDTEHQRIASMAKLLPLYGAFALRRALREAWASYDPDFAALVSAARAGLAKSGARVGTRPLIADLYQRDSAGQIDFKVGGPPTGGSPGARYPDDPPPSQNLSRLFWRTPPLGPLRMARTDGQLGSDAAVRAELQDDVPQGRVPMEDQLRLTAGWSDNVSAGVITQALGYPYLWALARDSGLWRPSWPRLTRHRRETTESGGLNLMLDYRGSGWMNPPVGAPTNTTQGATARSVACLMAMLARDRLVDPASDALMREMLRKSWLGATFRGESSPIGEGMRYGGWSAVQVPVPYGSGSTQPAGSPLAVSKIGLLDSAKTPAASNALIIRTTRERSTGGTTKPITAVLVGLNWKDDDVTVLQAFGKRMANLLDQRHGLKTTTAPPPPQ